MRKIKQIKMLYVLWIFVAFISQSIYTHAQQPQIIWLGTLGGNGSVAQAVSADGSVIVGVSMDSSGNPRAFKWTIATGIQNLGTLGGDWSEATDISADGSVIIGWSYDGNSIYRAFRWTASTGMQDIGAGDYSKTTAISANGNVILVNKDLKAYRWTASGGMVDIGNLGGNSTSAIDINSDGTMITGFSNDSSGDPYAFRWVQGSGMEQIGTFYSFGNGISGDGLTITGDETGSAGLHRAFRWTESGGFQFNIAGNFSAGHAVSGDGSLIVGDNGGGAFRFSVSGGLEELTDIYSWLLTGGSSLDVAFDISPDGQFIVGGGYNGATSQNEGFLLAISGITGVNEPENLPSGFCLDQNYPNPFNPSTTISFLIPEEEFVSLKVFNSIGEEIAVLVNETKSAGNYSVTFDAGKLASGIYFYKISAGKFFQTRKMMLVK